MPTPPTALIILDGVGHAGDNPDNAVYHARTPTLDMLKARYPHTLLQASGTAVGLPAGFIGNSEVGHMTIGCGRVITQPITILNDMIDDGFFGQQKGLLACLEASKQANGRLHVMGLLSDGGVHAHERQLHEFVRAAAQQGVKEIYVHAFIDGRDVAPRSAELYLGRLAKVLADIDTAKLGSIHGRFYAMDRDCNWRRTQQSYQVLTGQEASVSDSWYVLLEESYQRGDTDQFFRPVLLDEAAAIRNGDAVIFANVRPERARQLTAALLQDDFTGFDRDKITLSCFLTPVAYNDFAGVTVMLESTPIRDTLKDELSKADKTIFTIAETEKYAHVTYFFNGGCEKEEPGEEWVMIPSLPVREYVDHPHMSASEITHRLLRSFESGPCDFYLVNYANADMVGHSGNFAATVKAVECLDEQLHLLYGVLVERMGGTIYITADHGNAEDMFNEELNMPRTAHTADPVPFIAADPRLADSGELLHMKGLADIAPYILERMGLPVPAVMRR